MHGRVKVFFFFFFFSFDFLDVYVRNVPHVSLPLSGR